MRELQEDFKELHGFEVMFRRKSGVNTRLSLVLTNISVRCVTDQSAVWYVRKALTESEEV